MLVFGWALCPRAGCCALSLAEAAENHMASVDVVVPCYQYGRYLRDCVASVLQQDIEDVRVLIVDNASTDEAPR